MTRMLVAFLAVALVNGCQDGAPPAQDATPILSIERERITVSGVSSGAYMAGQLHVAHSNLISGAALIAGGPYACAGGSMQQALGPCIKGGEIDVAGLVDRAQQYAEAGRIDQPAGLANDRVWIFHGTADTAVDRSVSLAAAEFYRELVAEPATQVAFVDSVEAAHGMPTETMGVPCTEVATPFINACGYDAAGELLEHLYGALQPKAAPTAALETLSEAAFRDAGLWDYAYLYVPRECREGAACGLHVAFHGCLQSAELVGVAFAADAGYNAWAETNRLVVLYPQARASKLAPLNPLGCWDWWGYTNESYATQAGPQVAAVMALIGQLAGTR